MTTVIVHGAGSTGAAAAELLGAGDDAVLLEDRTGDVDQVIAAVDAAMAGHRECSALVGVSLGAHAVARWASTAAEPPPALICVLPAWTGAPDASAHVTAAAARSVAEEGIAPLLERLDSEGSHRDVVRLLQMAWSEYSEETLSRSLSRASTGRGPTPAELAAIRVRVAVVGWRDDAFHPATVAHQWARHLRRPTVALAARPETRLMRRALATCGWSP